jgi:hypothetical protein
MARAARRAFDPHRLAPVLVILVAGGLFALQLGHSSLFMDEVYSWQASRGSLGDLADALRYSEVTPPLYYLRRCCDFPRSSPGSRWLRRSYGWAGSLRVARRG